MESNNIEKEIDIADLGKSINSFVYALARGVLTFFAFLRRKAIVLILILIIGFSAGFGLDKLFTKYESQVIVTSNFESVDYLYNTVTLINSKIRQKDTKFLEKIGIKHTEAISSVEIEPIMDVYKFVTNNPQNFEMIKLFSESGDAQTTIKDLVTSKNYSSHQIVLTTNQIEYSEDVIQSILSYLNSNTYYNGLRTANIKNIEFKLVANEKMINQIDQILADFSENTQKNSQKGDKLVYYNDNTQLNDIINTRNSLVVTQGELEIEKALYDKFIKETSVSLNIKDSKSVTSKLKLVVPILFLAIYLLSIIIIILAKKSEK